MKEKLRKKEKLMKSKRNGKEDERKRLELHGIVLFDQSILTKVFHVSSLYAGCFNVGRIFGSHSFTVYSC